MSISATAAVELRRVFFQVYKSGPKISIFLTLHIVTRVAYSSPSKAPVGNAGNMVKFFTFTMAWKCFCYVPEVSGLIHKYNNHMIF